MSDDALSQIAERQVFCEDAVTWLKDNGPIPGASLLASLPDFSEFPVLTLGEWKEWFTDAAELVLKATPPEGVTLFFQSDIKVEGHWVDKAFLCQKAAEKLGRSLLWHKVFCRAPVDIATYGRPSYSHLLCFSETVVSEVARSTPDVISDLGEKTWARGMGLKASELACRFVAEETSTRILVNPFCGEGSVLAVAEAHGLSAIGIERSPKRAERSRKLRVLSVPGGSAKFFDRRE